MADHLRKQIRDAAASAVTGLATTGSNVHPNRVYPLGEAGLPALLVYTNEETSEDTNVIKGGGYRQSRELALVVEGVARGAEAALDDTLDAIAKEVEEAILADGTFDGLAKSTELLAIGIAPTVEGEKPHGRVRLTFTVRYETKAGVPDAAA